MQEEQLLCILKQMQYVCKLINQKTKHNNPNSKLVYEVLQLSDLAKSNQKDPRKVIKTIADFYNLNWKGNADFMHIPNYEQIMDNISKYPIIIAREEDSEEILAISTIKYDENSPEHLDPYFPFPDAKYFSVTGILTRPHTPYRGMGKKIYEIALKGAFQYNKKYPGTRLMFVVDARNHPSLNACSTAVKNINKEEYVGEGQGLPANIIGFYELYGKKYNGKNHLAEAPTVVCEVGLTPTDKSLLPSKGTTLRFYRQSKTPLLRSIQQKATTKFRNFGIEDPIVNTDSGTGTVYFYQLDKPCGIIHSRIVAGNTTKGNDRKPYTEDTSSSLAIPDGYRIYFGDTTNNLKSNLKYTPRPTALSSHLAPNLTLLENIFEGESHEQ